MANQEPAVCHAVIALGAAHQDIIFRGLHLFPSSERKRGVWYLYSLEESARAFELLRRRNTQDPQMRQVMLLCCLLFVFLNLVQRDYDTAFRHLRAGLQVLTELNSSGLPLFGTSAHIPVDPCLLAAFAQLETQSTHFSVINLQLWDHQLEFSQPRDNESDLLHQSVDERRRMIEPLINAMFKFFKRCWTESESEIASHYGELQSIQTRLISEVHRATLSFAKFYAVRYASLTRKQQRGADLIRLCLLTQSVGLRTSLIHNNPELLLPFTPDYAALLSQSKKIIAQFPDRPTVMVDTGVILPLYIVADACQDLTLRWEAIQVLRDWPHYEGPYDSVLVSIILAERCRVQMRARVHNELRALLDNEQLSHAAFESMVEAELRAQMRIVISQRGDGDDTRPVGSQTQTEADVEAEFSQAMSLECQKWTCIRRIKKLKE
ncbi:uncharacterized protein BO97DRAFT_408322 [Aspergillus homomorphus CBS 101889]|uniref:C6 zinc finger domain protein n=1 Tax=Aspergillus homomorphus (strain CBS 101889) TaxID=1450537 RepID=A0A395HL78_ASPHC|nr:hypothetical protein BO97DRAFT_408322 [Aspergillus homomorphus CBS 101889]RAL08520.1 hypothetical protein BO97DRAFT_408322 [Aspergillus homomorphus CBS 101889]